VRAIRQRFGGVPLMVDANAAYTLDDAAHLARLDGFGLMMIEQPLDYEDVFDHAALQRRMATPVCLDESIHSVRDARDAIDAGACRIINIKPGRVGGHAPSRAIHRLAQQRGVPVWCGGMLESGVGRAHNVALASLPGFSLPGDLSPSRRYWRRDVVDPEWTMAGGMLRVPRDRPGLGVEVDRDLVESLTVRRTEVEARRGT
jgi:O-succinylbenzoate synthase